MKTRFTKGDLLLYETILASSHTVPAMIKVQKPTIDDEFESIVRLAKTGASESQLKNAMMMNNLDPKRLPEILKYMKDLKQWKANDGMIPNPQVNAIHECCSLCAYIYFKSDTLLFFF